jgi:hypothetical protein
MPDLLDHLAQPGLFDDSPYARARLRGNTKMGAVRPGREQRVLALVAETRKDERRCWVLAEKDIRYTPIAGRWASVLMAAPHTRHQ